MKALTHPIDAIKNAKLNDTLYIDKGEKSLMTELVIEVDEINYTVLIDAVVDYYVDGHPTNPNFKIRYYELVFVSADLIAVYDDEELIRLTNEEKREIERYIEQNNAFQIDYL